MELKNVITLEYTKEGRIYRLEMPNEAPLGEAYEATAHFLSKLADFLRQHADAVMPQEALPVEEAPVQVADEK